MSANSPTIAPVPQPPDPAERGDQFLERQLRRTRWQVKLTDLAAACVELLAGLLAVLLVLVLIDHWLLGLGFWGRTAAFTILVLGVAWYVAARIAPLLVRPINPIYAAWTIEQSVPSLKNSLINFLLFRANRTAVHPGVFAALQDRATADIRQVSIDSAVDRSRLITAGYVLAGLLAIAAVYTILSPKDPLRTVSRVAAPWADIARPSRVEIVEVLPGDAEVYQGQQITASADVRGVAAGEPVTLVFSTADGQVSERPVAMQLAAGGLRYETPLPPGGGGVQQEISYRVRAGDAASRVYRLRVSPAPSIRVVRVDLDFPDYTRLTRRSSTDDGDIRAVEGTRVTVYGRANYPIRSAAVEFDPLPDGDEAVSARPRLPMEVRDSEAWREWTLELQPDRQTPRHSSYQLAFVTAKGQASGNPVVHRLEVIPDLAPELEVLTPNRERVDVPQDGQQKIEIRGVDPDFGLRSLRLRAAVAGADLLNETLMEDAAGRTGQVVVEYVFEPAKLGLNPGDEVVYWAGADDNRQLPGTQTPAPNVQRTRNRFLRIVAPTAGSPPTSIPDKPETESSSPAPKSDAGEQGGEKPLGGGGQGGSRGSSDAASDQSGEGSGSRAAGAPDAGKSSMPGEQTSEDGTGEGSTDAGPDRGGEASSEGSSPGAPGGSTSRQQSGDGEPGESSERQEPLHDGEVFEKALERLQSQQQPQPGAAGDKTGNGQSPAGAPNPSEGSTPGENAGSKPEDSQRSTNGDSSKSGQGTGPEKRAQADSGTDADAQGGQSVEPESQGAAAQDVPPKDAAPNGGRGSESPQSAAKRSGPGGEKLEGEKPGSRLPSPTDATGAAPNEQPADAVGQPIGNATDSSEKGIANERPSAGKAGESGSTTGRDSGDRPSENAGEFGSDAGGSAMPVDPSGKPAGEPGGETGTPQNAVPGESGNTGEAVPKQIPDSAGSPSSSSGAASEGARNDMPSGGGTPGQSQAATADSPRDVPDGEQANLDYARRATDMALEYLSQQESKPDPRLLDELGWTVEDLQRFLQRWRRLKESAREADAGQRELDETLRSLGLRPPRDEVRGRKSPTDNLEGLRDTGLRSSPPPQYLEQFDAFKKGTAKR